MLALSANGSAPGSGIVWALCPYSGDASTGTALGILRAFDASDVSKELWNSRQDASRDDVGTFAKFNTPTIANGKVYVPTFSGYLAVYGLLPPTHR
jgi:outer membrane protein assembly factor BamB